MKKLKSVLALILALAMLVPAGLGMASPARTGPSLRP